MDTVLWSIVTNASLAAGIVPAIQWLRVSGRLPVRLARIVSAALAAVAAAGITYSFNGDTGDLTINLYAVLAAIPLFVLEFLKQFGIQEGLYQILHKLFSTPASQVVSFRR